MELTVSGLNKATLAVSVRDSGGSEVFSEVFTGNGTRTFWVPEGACRVEASIVTAKGNGKFGLSLLMPEVVTVEFEEEEVPLAGHPVSVGPSAFEIVRITMDALILAGVGAVIVLLLKKRGR